MTKNKYVFFISLMTSFLLFGNVSIAEEKFTYKTIPPRNTITENPSATRFIKRLKKIVEEKDTKALLRRVDSKIKFSFGDGGGIKDFREHWGLNKEPKKSELWRELDRMLSLGGVMEGEKEIAFPYVYADWSDEFDAFDYQVITGKKVNFRENPSTKSKIIRQLNYEIVLPINAAEDDEKSVWQKIKTYDKKIGYVHKDYVRSAIDYRMFFEKVRKGWKMTMLVAGD